MAKKKQGKALAFAKYALILGVDALFSLLPYGAARFLAHRAADVWRRIDARHARIAAAQSMECLGIDAEAANRLVRDNYRHYAMLAMEVFRLRRMPIPEVLERTDVGGRDREIRMLADEGKGVIIVTGHLGNWEWGSVVLGTFGSVAGFIARPLINPYFDAYVNRMRERGGAKVWSKFGGIRNALKALRRGRGFVVVADQDGGPNGTPVPFLGKIGSTMAMPVDLSIHTGAPIIVGGVFRVEGELRFKFESVRIHRPNLRADVQSERMRLLVAVNDDLSNLVRRHPEQWLWIHRRWRTRECRENPGRAVSSGFGQAEEESADPGEESRIF